MKALWTQMAARINAMSLRERFLIFACLVGVLGAITDLIFIEPLLAQQKILITKLDKKSFEMDIQQDEINLEIRKRSRERAVALNAGIVKVQLDIDAIEKEIASLLAIGGDPVAMPSILSRVLRRSDKVMLLRVVQVGAELGTAGPVGVAGANRGGLDITLSGNYLDLMEYLSSLEKTLTHVRWGAFLLRGESFPAQLTVRIVTMAAES
ncbi:MAG: hypothetical protein WCL29_06115 [Pseudomonadota bacterium]